MVNDFSLEEIQNYLAKNKSEFIENKLNKNNCVYVSKLPVELMEVRFRLSIYIDSDKISKITLVAVQKQKKAEYENKTTDEIHKKWLKSIYGNPNEEITYGCKYALEWAEISSEHDPRSGSDIIIVRYITNVSTVNHEQDYIQNIIKKINVNIIGGKKIPHSTSQPVIYQESGKYYLAVFVFFYTKEDIEAGAVDRPTIWALADIETGEIIEERQTKDKDFSQASYDVKYNVRSDAQFDTSKKYYDEAFAILDSVRTKIITSGKFYALEYKYYLDKILANIPKDYQGFYTDLSV